MISKKTFIFITILVSQNAACGEKMIIVNSSGVIECPLYSTGTHCEDGLKTLFSSYELPEILSKYKDNNCRLPYSEELKDYFSDTANLSLAEGLYWCTYPDKRSKGYSWYVHYPSGQLREYGNLSFPAYILLWCDK